MNTCIVAINSGYDRCMGYACSQQLGGMSFKISNQPVFKSGKNLLVGVSGEEKLLTSLKLSPIIINGDITPEQAITSIRNNIPKGHHFSEVLILSANNFIYRWYEGRVDLYTEFDEPFMAIGKGKEIALGTLYGLNTSRFTVKEQIEVCLKAVGKYYPELNKNTGVLSI